MTKETSAAPDQSHQKKPIINCHTHIFTGSHVPPFFARTFVPWPFYYLLPVSLFVHFFRWWYHGPARIPYLAWYKKSGEVFNRFQTLFNRLGFIRTLAEYYVALHAFFFLYDLVSPVFPPDRSLVSGWISSFRDWFNQYSLLSIIQSNWVKALIIVVTVVLFPAGRNLIIFIFKQLFTILKKLPGKGTKEMFLRYLNIGRFAFHKEQGTILGQLQGQYPRGTGLVVLPMDMEYMGAGKPPVSYRRQMEKLAELKNKKAGEKILFPFVFADPRRIANEKINPGEKIYFDYGAKDGEVKLRDCFIRDYIEEKGFSGFKIYPALGYYPFDENLLPLWKYAADNGIPVMTHCVSGPMFYRGPKKEAWGHHPFFEQSMGKSTEKKSTGNHAEGEDTGEDHDGGTIYEPLSLPQKKNSDYTANFTHPMNFLCLLEEELLCKVVSKAYHKTKDERLKQVFGYEEGNGQRPESIRYNLKHLKICLGHYGGGDQWNRYFEKDRYGYSNRINRDPKGILFLKTLNDQPTKGKIEPLWKYTDWYSIISSMMLQYDHVYADISYILHAGAEILPLLKQTLQHPGLRKKVLYGTDFYVVRNHKSDKNMLADMMGGLSEKDFDAIARENPATFLENRIKTN